MVVKESGHAMEGGAVGMSGIQKYAMLLAQQSTENYQYASRQHTITWTHTHTNCFTLNSIRSRITMLHKAVEDMMRKPYNDKTQQLSKNQRNTLKFIYLINLMLGSRTRSPLSLFLPFRSLILRSGNTFSREGNNFVLQLCPFQCICYPFSPKKELNFYMWCELLITAHKRVAFCVWKWCDQSQIVWCTW